VSFTRQKYQSQLAVGNARSLVHFILQQCYKAAALLMIVYKYRCPQTFKAFFFNHFLPSLDTQHCSYLILLHQYIYTCKLGDCYSVAITAIHHGQKRVHVCHSKHPKRTVVVPPPIPSPRPLLCVSKMTLHHFSCQSQGARHSIRSKARSHSRMRPRTTVRSFLGNA